MNELRNLNRFKGRIGYQILVDRYYRDGKPPSKIEGRILKDWDDDEPNWRPNEEGKCLNNYFYGGNLRGIIAKLDYIKSMGFDLIYMSPISKTPSSHHYDVGMQLDIDPWIGTKQDLSELVKQAHKRDILLFADLVFNHIGAYTEIFKEAVANKKSRYHDWFEWDEEGNPIYWYGILELPQCNKLNPNFQKHAQKVIQFYLELGFDGIRLDLGETFPREFMEAIYTKVKEVKPDTLIVSEMWKLATANHNPQIFEGQIDSVMNYPSGDAICRWLRYGNWKHLVYTLKELKKYPNRVKDFLWNFLDSHDTPRVANLLCAPGMNEEAIHGDQIWEIEEPWRHAEDFDFYSFRKFESEHESDFDISKAYEMQKQASVMQYFMRGIPIVYAGTEVGLTGYKDPWNRKPYPWDNINTDLQEHYRKLAEMRKNAVDVFLDGEIYVEVDEEKAHIWRVKSGQELHVIINRSSEGEPFSIYKVDKIIL